MEEKQNLYLVKTRSYRSYVVATSPNEAWETFKNYLENIKGGYGFSNDRLLESIEVIAAEETRYPISNTRGYGENGYDLLILKNRNENREID